MARCHLQFCGIIVILAFSDSFQVYIMLRSRVDLRDNVLNYLNIGAYVRIDVCVSSYVQLVQCSDITYLAYILSLAPEWQY